MNQVLNLSSRENNNNPISLQTCKKRKVYKDSIETVEHIPVNESHVVEDLPKYDYPPQEDWKELGSGTFGVVFETEFRILSTENQNQVLCSFNVAIKRIPIKAFQLSELRRMQNLEKKTKHVVRLLDFWKDAFYVFLVLEKLEEIVNKKGKLSYKKLSLRIILRQMLIGLKECHDAGFIHGDFKPSNIMVNESTQTIKLIDWDDTAYDPKYSKSDNPESRKKRRERDLFAYAVSAFELIVGFLPDPRNLFIPNRIDDIARDFITLAFSLVDNPKSMYSSLLEHPYLN